MATPSTPSTHAVAPLPPGDRPAFDALVARLQSGSPVERSEAAGALAPWGSPALAPLCCALLDRDPAVQQAAAAALGEIGDPRAVAPLAGVLRSQPIVRPGQSGRRLDLLLIVNAVIVAATLWALAGAILSYRWEWAALAMLGAWCVFLGLTGRVVGVHRARARARHSAVYRAVAEALARIGERNPDPQLRELLPELAELAGSRRQSPATRAAARAAAARIDALTAALQSLPIAAEPASPPPATLPRPSASPPPEPPPPEPPRP